MADIFLFDGGFYKRGTDDGRIRVPLKSGLESQTIMYDPELQADAQSSLGGVIHMGKYADIFDNLAVGDAVYVHLVPDAMGVRGHWAASQDSIPGFTVDFDIVSIQDVDAAIDAGNLGSTVAGLTPAVPYDFSIGIGDAAYDAHLQGAMHNAPFTDYRNPAAVQAGYYATPVMLGVGQSAYMRFVITALPTAVVDDGCSTSCNTCGGKTGWPMLQYGLVVDRLCFAKNLVRNYCNCNDPICAGCDSTETVYE